MLTLILKIIALFILATQNNIKINENEPNINSNSNISYIRIDDRISNWSSSIKKMSSRVYFLIFKTSLVLSQLKKIFTKTLILHYFDPEYYVLIKTNILSYVINQVLSELTL